LIKLKPCQKVMKCHADYNKNSEDAIKEDVFGAPSYVLNNEIYWGQDRLEYLEDALKK
jgi:2-hydroxychromene-2-carboxylate isomerase